ncbi:hypothetical protein FOZ63_018866 [Perkinsus olseni]|uniref:DUF4371 domain-containing protein n=1 Tax=Perkinsus olseni TaxID=32597 RepID=A0A7J6QQT3_PEROL|nr:hypothetical protein FOZ63_018866 [Perkinsus olseni]
MSCIKKFASKYDWLQLEEVRGKFLYSCKTCSSFKSRKSQWADKRECGCKKCGDSTTWKPGSRLMEHEAAHKKQGADEGGPKQLLFNASLQKSKAKLEEKRREREEEQNALMLPYFDAVDFAAKEYIAMRKVPGMLKLMGRHGVAVPKTWLSPKYPFVVARSLHGSQAEAIKILCESRPVLAVTCDEGTDISVTKHLLIYVRLPDVTKQICLGLVELPGSSGENIAAGIIERLGDFNIPLNKVVSVATDGAASMVGTASGAVTHLSRSIANSLDLPDDTKVLLERSEGLLYVKRGLRVLYLTSTWLQTEHQSVWEAYLVVMRAAAKLKLVREDAKADESFRGHQDRSSVLSFLEGLRESLSSRVTKEEGKLWATFDFRMLREVPEGERFRSKHIKKTTRWLVGVFPRFFGNDAHEASRELYHQFRLIEEAAVGHDEYDFVRASKHVELTERGRMMVSIADVVRCESATAERGFSAMNRIKDSSRNRLKTRHLNAMLMLAVNSSFTPPLEEGIKVWRRVNRREKVGVGAAKSEGSKKPRIHDMHGEDMLGDWFTDSDRSDYAEDDTSDESDQEPTRREGLEGLYPLLSDHGRIVNVCSYLGRLAEVNAEPCSVSEPLQKRFSDPNATEESIDNLVEEFLTGVKEGDYKERGFNGSMYGMYGLSKLALIAWTKVLAREAMADPRKILVTGCCPGWCQTDMSNHTGRRSAETGAQVMAWLAAEVDYDPTMSGKLYRDNQEFDWQTGNLLSTGEVYSTPTGGNL